MTTVGSTASVNSKNTTTVPGTVNSTKTSATKKTGSDVASILSEIRKLSTSDKKIDALIDKFSKIEHSDEDLLKLQNALTSRQKQSDTLSNIMRSLHEMSMNVVRNMKLN